MPNPVVRQLHAAIAQIDQAIYNHEQWYKNVLRVLIARLPPDAADLLPDAHRHCRFGQWYDGDAVRSFGNHPGFVALGQAHEQMHSDATQLLQRVADELPISPTDLDRFNNVLDRLRLEFQSLRVELAETMQNRDPLAGARNRASMLADLRERQAMVRRGVQCCALASTTSRRLTTAMHAVGDAVLVATAQCLEAQVRPYDRLYRYGGEEFLLCMPNSTLDEATAIAEQLRVAVAEQQIQTRHNDSHVTIQITASFRVVAMDPERPIEESIDRADQCLYQAKNAGRDRVEVFR